MLTNRKLNGIGMIEVLVTILIVGIGMLAVARMQIISMQANHEAFQRSLAVQLANDIIDKIRAVSSFNTAGYDAAVLGGNTITAEPTPDCTGTVTSCTTNDKIAHDLWEWEQLLDGSNELSGGANSGGLSNARGCINVNNNHIQVIITWDGFSNAVQSTALSAAANCGNLGATALEKRRQITIQTVI
jgi:type IV pilus assembly protein PilV